MTKSRIMIVAYDENRAIGKEGKIPWRLKGDMEHFKKTTDHRVVIMGRKTWESLPPSFRPLPNRTNIVITRNPELLNSKPIPGLWFIHSFESYLERFQYDSVPHYIIGGEQIYKEALPHCGFVIASEIKTKIEGADTFFPTLSEDWEVASKKTMPEENNLAWDIVIYRRKEQ